MSGVRSWSLRARLLLASAVLAVLVTAAFLILVQAVTTLQSSRERESHAKELTGATLVLEKLVVDLETGVRGFLITRNDAFLAPWTKARAELPGQLARFQRLASGDPAQERRARELVRAIRSYLIDYSIPLARIAREEPAAASQSLAFDEARRRIDEIRADFDSFLRIENARADMAAAAADDRSRLAIAVGLTALGLTGLLIVLFGLYLARGIARPVREAAGGASRLAAGDLSVRLAGGGPGEIGDLTHAFNRMAEALAQGRAELDAQYERLRESEQLKTDLISIVSHELRTPLASMLGFTSLLLQRDTDAETRMRYLEIIDSQGRRLAALLDDFLNVQRLEDGGLDLASDLVDMATVLREQAQLFGGGSDRHRLELSIRSGQLPVRGDANRLAQVVGNLLSNAIKYSPGGGVVEIVGERDDGTVRISVRDEGIGISADQREKIFTKFFRGDAAASGIAGSGLGLAFARAVVEAHGGRMSFTSEHGKGSVFSVELPTPAGAAVAGAGMDHEKGD